MKFNYISVTFMLYLQAMADLSSLVYSPGCNQKKRGGQNEDGKRKEGARAEEGGVIYPEISSGQIQEIEKKHALCS